MFEFTESPGEKNKKSEKWNFLTILHVKHTEGSLMALTEFDPNVKIFETFLDFYQPNN